MENNKLQEQIKELKGIISKLEHKLMIKEGHIEGYIRRIDHLEYTIDEQDNQIMEMVEILNENDIYTDYNY